MSISLNFLIKWSSKAIEIHTRICKIDFLIDHVNNFDQYLDLVLLINQTFPGQGWDLPH